MFKHGFPPEWSTFKKLIWLVGSGIAGGASAVWKTVTGTLIHITDALASPVKELSVAIDSETGATGCNIFRTGINLFDGEMENGDISETTGQNNGTSSSRYRSKNYIPIRASSADNEYVSFYFNAPGRTGTVRAFFYDENKNYLWWYNINVNTATVDFHIGSIAKYMRFRFGTGKKDGDSQISINIPSTVTEYVPYVSNTYPISWQTEAGSITSGTLEIAEDGGVTLSSGGNTYQLASITPISTLAGENNIWADVNGEITLTYQAVSETAFSDETDKGMADYMTLTE